MVLVLSLNPAGFLYVLPRFPLSFVVDFFADFSAVGARLLGGVNLTTSFFVFLGGVELTGSSDSDSVDGLTIGTAFSMGAGLDRWL